MANHQILHSGYTTDVLRAWQSRTSKINPDCLIYPVFISSDKDAFQEIKSLAGQYRIGINRMVAHLKPMVNDGLKTILIFGVLTDDEKRENSESILNSNPVFAALKLLKEAFPALVLACDVCLCGYTTHGHCYVFNEKMQPDMTKTLSLLSEAASLYAEAGADVIAPSDMMDGRILAIHKKLKIKGLRRKVALMSYSAKFSSCFYGPFRDAAGSSPQYGDRKSYQLPLGSSGLANRAVDRDIKEGADIVMVKPGMPYLDVVRNIKIKHPDYPIAIYQVSGEYAMLYHASQNGAFELKEAVIESLECMHRAGADIIISYFTPDLLKWLKD